MKSTPQARHIRVLCEYHEPAERLRKHGIWNTIMVFGSARSKSRAQYDAALADLTARVAAHPGDAKVQTQLTRLQKTEWMCPFYDAGVEMGRLLAKWGADRVAEGKARYTVCTGGGPGMMEAVNKGAASVKGAFSIGMAIKLPFEKGLNKYVTPELAFVREAAPSCLLPRLSVFHADFPGLTCPALLTPSRNPPRAHGHGTPWQNFHYFFTRKLWMSLPCEALVVAPGGFGTCDELFELMTLIQCGKAAKMPVVLLGGSYWKKVINWQAMADAGTVSQADVDSLFFCETAQEATDYIVRALEENEDMGVVGADGETKW